MMRDMSLYIYSGYALLKDKNLLRQTNTILASAPPRPLAVNSQLSFVFASGSAARLTILIDDVFATMCSKADELEFHHLGAPLLASFAYPL